VPTFLSAKVAAEIGETDGVAGEARPLLGEALWPASAVLAVVDFVGAGGGH